MAEGLDIKRGNVQCAVTCDTCDNTAEHLCKTCYDKLCTYCKDIHSKSRSSYDHQVTKLNSESLSQLAAEPLVCRTHPGCGAEVCCRKCEIPVCEKCLVDEHRDHKTISTEELFLVKRKKLDEKYFFVQSEFPKYQAQIKKLKESEKKNEKSMEMIENEIISHFKEARQKLDFEENLLLRNSKAQHQCEKRRLETQKTRVSEYLDKIQSFTKMYHKDKQIKSYAFILYANVSIDSTIPETFPSFQSPFSLKFTKGTLNENIFAPPNTISDRMMHEMLEVEKINVGTGEVETLTYQLNDDTFWVYLSDETCFQKFSRSGHVLFDLDADVSNKLNKPICVIPNGNVVFRKKADSLKQVNANKKETKFAKLDDVPMCICLSKQNTEIAVAIIDSEETEVSLLKFSNDGQCLDKVNNSRLFKNSAGEISDRPKNMVENINRDIITSSKEVAVFDQTGKFRFSYVGSGNTKFPFDSRGICTDAVGNILIADVANRFIHVLDIEGKLQKKFHVSSKKDEFDPITLAIDANHCLCVGCSDGKI